MYLDKANSMPLVLKLCHYNSNGIDVRNIPAIDNALKLVEKILIQNDLYTRWLSYQQFNIHSEKYKPDEYDNLIADLTYKCCHGFKEYWNFNGDCLRYFTANKYHYRRELRYVLYKI